MFDRNASYTIVYEDDQFVFLVDDDHGITVTNDAENVCRKVLSGINSRSNKRIIYRDTNYHWDEMLHNGFSFFSFAALHSGDQALEIIDKVESAGILNNR